MAIENRCLRELMSSQSQFYLVQHYKFELFYQSLVCRVQHYADCVCCRFVTEVTSTLLLLLVFGMQ